MPPVTQTNAPYGLQLPESCITCNLRKDGWFCGLPENVLRELGAVSFIAPYPGGALLFVEGQPPQGAFVLCSGQVELSMSSGNGKSLVLRTAYPGEIVGLDAVISGGAHVATAKTIRPCVINRIDRNWLLRSIEQPAI